MCYCLTAGYSREIIGLGLAGTAIGLCLGIVKKTQQDLSQFDYDFDRVLPMHISSADCDPILMSQPCQRSKPFEAMLQGEQERSVACVPNRDTAMNHQMFLRHFCKGYNPLLMTDCLVPWVRMKNLSELFACGCAC